MSKKKSSKSAPQADEPVIPAKQQDEPLVRATAPDLAVESETVDSDEPTVSSSPLLPETSTPDTPELAAEFPVEPAQPDQPVDEHREPVAERPARRPSRRLLFMLAGLLTIATAVWYVQHARTSLSSLQKADKQLVSEVGQRAVLPRNETPTITTVVDKTKVNQTFLAQAENGDKVLLYFQSGRAILYRPSTRQVVNIGPLTQPPARVFVRSSTAGNVPAAITNDLTPSAGFTVSSRDRSTRTYDQTLVIDLSGNRPDVAARAAKLVGGKVAPLPDGESRPDADILIIVGSQAN